MSDECIILFDGICNLCNASVQFVIKHDPTEKFQFASLQGKAGKGFLKSFNLPQNDFFSFVLIENGKAYTKSTAALRVSRYLSWPVNWLYGFIIVPPFIRDAVYNLIAKNRYRWFGKLKECMIPTAQLKNRFLD
ncbi:MAG: thiol-disulfide oxidoreductase DCC family protein [Chitinophagaceae bacterium]|nr:thiol-disulfide oxidoreductase DCC family protein [Bacteroidota bacterium]MCC6257589.1 thiol-disulfide oxidoreductase DCC family protein [Chitinophagaceae bacterium]MCW5916711.1 thiol-disulfide oxidoreductase DCC family protein [Ferruginibacter sp.]